VHITERSSGAIKSMELGDEQLNIDFRLEDEQINMDLRMDNIAPMIE